MKAKALIYTAWALLAALAGMVVLGIGALITGGIAP